MALHVGVMAGAVLLSRQPAVPEGERAAPDRSERQLDLVYLPPPLPPPPPPPPPPEPEQPQPRPEPPRPAAPPARPVAPPPEQEQRVPEPEANAPPDAVRSEGEDESEAEGAGTPEATPGEAATMESEARRIFGRPRIATAPGVGPRAVRPMEAYLPEDPAKCVPRPTAPRDSAAPVEFGVVEGRILRADNGRPLAGAHLQMVGTPYVAFTDDLGDYRFRFDLSLVDQCRTQYVRVTAKGYQSRLLVLVVGPNVRSEDVRLERKSWLP